MKPKISTFELNRFIIISNYSFKQFLYNYSKCARSLLLATSDSGGLPGHASGCLQGALLMLMLAVEAALFGLETWHRKGIFFGEVNDTKQD